MSLRMYENAGGVGDVISDSGSLTNPILWEASQQGGILERRFWLRSDNTFNERFENVRIYAQDANYPSEAGWFTFALDSGSDSPGTYQTSLSGLTVESGLELPIWINVDIPANLELGAKTDIKILVDYTQLDV